MTDYVTTEEIDFSEWLSETLNTYKISSSQLAREIDVNRSTVSLWRSGQRLPTCRLKVRIADALEKRDIDNKSALLREILWRCHVSEWRNHEA
tara:strand:+ start:22429 stop:22707 length:279 start_codon:yes stop_codon:yes gene_type:complete